MNIRYVFNKTFNNGGGEVVEFTFPAAVALIQNFNSQTSSVLPSVFVARAVLPMDGRLM